MEAAFSRREDGWYIIVLRALFDISLFNFVFLQPYQEAAEQDKERYIQELSAYKQTDAYKEFNQQQLLHQEAQNKKQKAMQEMKKAKPIIETNEEVR